MTSEPKLFSTTCGLRRAGEAPALWGFIALGLAVATANLLAGM